MRKFLLLLTAGFFFVCGVLSNNTNFMKAWVAYRSSPTSRVPSESFLYGDLYSYCHLPQYREHRFVGADVQPVRQVKARTNGLDLYGLCDSYLYMYLSDSLLPYADHYRFDPWGQTRRFRLDPKRRNVLLLETVERNARALLMDTALVYRHLQIVSNTAAESTEEQSLSNGQPVAWMDREFYTRVFNRNIEQNLEFNFFNYAIFRPFKEAKAILNYKVFGRTSEEVEISSTRKQLYYAPTVDTTSPGSSFSPLSAGEVDTMVNNLNIVRRHYRRLGFEDVVLALMPNPVTVLEPHLYGRNYNGLVPRIQQHPALQLPVIDVYKTLLERKSQPIYQASDTHWSRDGFLAGLSLLNSALVAQRPTVAQQDVAVATATARPAKQPTAVVAVASVNTSAQVRTLIGTGVDSAIRSEQYAQQRVLRDTGKTAVTGVMAMGSNGQAQLPQARGGAGSRTWPQDGRL